MKKKIIIDGKEEAQKKSLYDILNMGRYSPFKDITKSQYEKEIKGMDATQLHEHALEAGLTPISNRRVLEERLVREFSIEKSKMNVSKPKAALTGKRAKKFMELMGRKK